MSWTPPTVSDFKAKFVRDFNYGTDINTSILDSDIQGAIDEALVNFTDLYGGGANTTTVFLYVAAFYMVFSFQNSAKGIGSRSNFPISSNSVGGVSVSYSIPSAYQDSPIVSMYSQNGYGMKFLSFALPYIVGNVQLVCGDTTFA